MDPKDKNKKDDELFEDGKEGYATPELAPFGDNNPNLSSEDYDLDQEKPTSGKFGDNNPNLESDEYELDEDEPTSGKFGDNNPNLEEE